MSEQLKNLYELARKANEKEDFDESDRYYRQILLIDPKSWEATLYLAVSSSAASLFEDEELGTAINTFHDSLDEVLNLIDDYAEKGKQSAAVEEVYMLTVDACKLFHEHTEKEFNETQEVCKELQSYDDEKGTEYSSESYKIRGLANRFVAKIYTLLGFWILERFDDRGDVGKLGISAVNEAVRLIENYTYWYFSDRERKDTASEYRQRMTDIREKAAKRRFVDYWNAHKSEKDLLETEKDSLEQQLAVLNKEMKSTPGYSEIQKLEDEVKKHLSTKPGGLMGLFKSKEKKIVDDKVAEIKTQIAQIQTRITPVVNELKRKITPIQRRKDEIEKELTKPR